MAHTETNRTPMLHPRALISTAALVLLLGGCIMPARQDATPVPPLVKGIF